MIGHLAAQARLESHERLCANPACGGTFYSVKWNRLFCSTRCVRAVRNVTRRALPRKAKALVVVPKLAGAHPVEQVTYLAPTGLIAWSLVGQVFGRK